jgi:hypothetical protein
MEKTAMTDREKDESARWQHLKDRLAKRDSLELPEEVLDLARAVAGVRDTAMPCEECRSWLPTYVDAEVGGLAAGEKYPAVKRHLSLCPDCEAEYLAMLELAMVEDAGELLAPEELPAPDLTFLPPVSLTEYVLALAEDIISVKAPHLVADIRAISDIFFERVAALGQQFALGPSLAPAMGFGAGEVPEALEVLAATFAATQSLLEGRSPQEIEAYAQSGQLQAILSRQGKQAAQALGLSSQQARSFAETYAELAGQNPDILRALAKRRAG